MNKSPVGSLQIIYQTGDGFRYFLSGMMEPTDLYVLPKLLINSIEPTEATLCNPHQLHKLDMSKHNRVIIDQNVISKNPRSKMNINLVKICQGKDVIMMRYTPLNNFKGDCYQWSPEDRELKIIYVRKGLSKVIWKKLHEGYIDPMTRWKS